MALQDFSKYTRITVNPALPKNEKDLICALLAGRLRDLFNGRLFCLNLAIADLAKDATGLGLDNLVSGLNSLQGTLGNFKDAVGYDRILGSINNALGGIGTVFSLGGLCPSPITPPRIPDIMPQVNAALFGQGMNIINSLGRVLNPNMCFGGGPGGFGVNFNTMPGSLQQLKSALDRFKNDPAGLESISKAFEANIKMQERRLNAELNRLQTNLSDPFGLQQAKQRAAALKAAHSRSADYAVTDSNGIKRQNVVKSLVPGDTLALLNVSDTTPILYKREAILNYCGDEVGIRLVPISGDIDYAGWDTNPAADNSLRPFGHHQLPAPGDMFYDYVIAEEFDEINVYKYSAEDQTLVKTDTVDIARGTEYRIKLSLFNYAMSIRTTDNSIWNNGIEFSSQGGAGNEILEQAENLTLGEIDWPVLIENPTTPNSLKFVFTNGKTVQVNVSGPTAIPAADKVYDLADIVLKAVFFHEEINQGLDDFQVPVLTQKKDLRYSCTAKLITQNFTRESTQEITYSDTGVLNSYRYIDDPNSDDTADKILELKTLIGDLNLSTRIHVNDLNGITFKKLSLEISNGTLTGYTVAELEDPVTVINNTKLPYKDSYKQRIVAMGGNNVLADETEFVLLNNATIRWHLTGQRPGNLGNANVMAYYDIDIANVAKPILKSANIEVRNDPNLLQINWTKIG